MQATDSITLSTALRNIVAGMFEILVIVLALIAIAWAITLWLNREHQRPVSPTTKADPSPKQHRALEAANRTPTIVPKSKP